MHFIYFKTIFGIYLAFHFATLIPYANEMFDSKMPYNQTLVPTSQFPNILNYIPPIILLGILVTTSILFIGDYHRLPSFILFIGWSSLLCRNPLIYNPGIPYVGWILLACVFIPSKSKYVPKEIFYLGYFLLGLGYTISGLHKLQCPSWIDGTALIHILNSPLARDNFIRNMMVMSPEIILKISSWLSLALEILFLPLGMFHKTRKLFCVAFLVFHIGILMMINFTDLTMGVLMIHIFTFDPELFDLLNR